jgi:hypothetical protein
MFPGDLQHYVIARERAQNREYLLGKYHADLYHKNVIDMERNPAQSTRVWSKAVSAKFENGNDRNSGTQTGRTIPEHRKENVKTSPANVANENAGFDRFDHSKTLSNQNRTETKEQPPAPLVSVTAQALSGHVKKSDIEYPELVLNGTNWMSFADTMTSLPRGVLSFLGDFRINENVPMKIKKPLASYVEVVNHFWQLVTADVEIYIYSAYYDDR